jgi:uncharacterized protein (DUF1778 family)
MAYHQDMDMTQFVVSTACVEAEQVLADQRQFVLSPKAWKEFTAALDWPPQVNPKLRELFSKPSILES